MMNSMNLDSLIHAVEVDKETLTKRMTSLYDVLLVANNVGLGNEGVTIVKTLNRLLAEIEDARTKVYWRTRWSHGYSKWEKQTFHPSYAASDIAETITEAADQENNYSEHYRGCDHVIVKSWLEDPDAVFAIVKVMKN